MNDSVQPKERIRIDRSVSDGIFRHQLEGFERYPTGRDVRFLEVFNEQVVSVDHARSVALAFRDRMPTLQEIVDTAVNLRPQFELSESQKKEWERKYGPPQPFEVSVSAPKGEREIDRLWREVMRFLRSTNFDGKGDIQRVHIGRCWQIARALGYQMTGPQLSEIETYEGIYPQSRQNLPVKGEPVRQYVKPATDAEVARLIAQQRENREPGEGE